MLTPLRVLVDDGEPEKKYSMQWLLEAAGMGGAGMAVQGEKAMWWLDLEDERWMEVEGKVVSAHASQGSSRL